MLYRLLVWYFSKQPPVWLESSYRRFGVAMIWLYRGFIRPWLGRECPFHVSCSELTRRALKSSTPFAQVRQTCLQRYHECSRPIQVQRINQRLRFLTHTQRTVDPAELNPKWLENAIRSAGQPPSLHQTIHKH